MRVGADGAELGELEPDDAGERSVRVGDHVAAQLRNDSGRPIYAALLVVSPDGCIDPAYSVPDHQPLAPGRTVSVPTWEVWVPPGAEAYYEDEPDLHVWVVSTSHADLSELQQDSVVDLGTRGLAGKREGGEDPVEAWSSSTTRVRVLPRER